MTPLLWLALFASTVQSATSGQYPCKAVHYAQPGHGTTMYSVMRARICPTGHECIPGFAPRADVEDYIAVRYLDRWRIGQNWRALVTFKLPGGGWSRLIWLQPVDYQAPWDVRSDACRVETSWGLAHALGWSANQGYGTTIAWIVRWER